MIDKTKTFKILSTALAAALIISPAQAFAWGGESYWQRDRDRDHRRDSDRRRDHFPDYRRHYPSHGTIVFDLPFGAVKVIIGGKRYYYCDGVFYHRSNYRYIVIPPPIGAVVHGQPEGTRPIIINGIMYYTVDGMYYQNSPQGYVVVAPPQVGVIQTVPVAASDLSSGTLDTYTVNIMNSKGGYTSVALKKSGNGFIGPQGEFYPEFPKVEQLKVMYGK